MRRILHFNQVKMQAGNRGLSLRVYNQSAGGGIDPAIGKPPALQAKQDKWREQGVNSRQNQREMHVRDSPERSYCCFEVDFSGFYSIHMRLIPLEPLAKAKKSPPPWRGRVRVGGRLP